MRGDNFTIVTDPQEEARVLAEFDRRPLVQRLRDIGYRSLGWENGWSEQPAKYVACRAAGHQLRTQHNHERCVSLTYCEQCRFFFQTDSSG